MLKIISHFYSGGTNMSEKERMLSGKLYIARDAELAKYIPDGSVAAGNPCREIKSITVADREYWNKLKDEYYDELGVR